MDEKKPKTFSELLKTITPPNGVHFNKDGSELLNCDGDVLDPSQEMTNGSFDEAECEAETIETLHVTNPFKSLQGSSC